MARRGISPSAFTTFRRQSPRVNNWGLAVSAAAYTNVPAASAVLLVRFSAAALANVSPGTIVRTRGVISILSDQEAAIESFFGAFAIGIVSDRSAAAGVGSLPIPITSINDDRWFVWQTFMDRFIFQSAVLLVRFSAAA